MSAGVSLPRRPRLRNIDWSRSVSPSNIRSAHKHTPAVQAAVSSAWPAGSSTCKAMDCSGDERQGQGTEFPHLECCRLLKRCDEAHGLLDRLSRPANAMPSRPEGARQDLPIQGVSVSEAVAWVALSAQGSTFARGQDLLIRQGHGRGHLQEVRPDLSRLRRAAVFEHHDHDSRRARAGADPYEPHHLCRLRADHRLRQEAHR